MTNPFETLTEAFKNLPTKIEVPEAAREFVTKAVGTAQAQAVEFKANADKLTAEVETAVANSVAETTKISRTIQEALFADTKAFFESVTKIASSASLNDAVAAQTEYLRAQGELATARAKDVSEYVGKLVAEGTKTAQENMKTAQENLTKAFANKAA